MRRSIILLAILLAVSSSAVAQYCDEEVVFGTSAGTIDMYHTGALFNCCAWLDIEVTESQWLIEFTEWEMFEHGPCYCLCCFDATATVSGLEPGEYTVRVWRALDNFDETWTFIQAAEETVLVEGYAEPSLTTGFVPCVESAVIDGSEETTWGTIKALYH